MSKSKGRDESNTMSGNIDSSGGTPAVLIVDDDPGNLLALEAVLEPLQCRLVRLIRERLPSNERIPTISRPSSWTCACRG
jgi:hypothetical protein